MKADDVLRAMRAEMCLETRELAIEVWQHVFGRIKPAGLRHLPISPVEAERLRVVCRTVLMALDRAERASPVHFEEVPAPKKRVQHRRRSKA